MPYQSKKIICLAKSRKIGGFCIAGKEILEDNSVGQWIRPVSSRKSDEISVTECRFENRRLPRLLDIIEIPLKKHDPDRFQCENYLIDEDNYWSKEGEFDSEDLINICDDPSILWGPDNSSYYGLRDRVEECNINDLNDSLYLISPIDLTIDVHAEGIYFGQKRKVRARFNYNGIKYCFSITDPIIENRFFAKQDGDYQIDSPENRVFLCVSIGLPYERDNYCYKFVASIIGI